MATCTDLTDAQQEWILPLLPTPKATVRPHGNGRTTVNGILFVLRMGLRWQGLTKRNGKSRDPLTAGAVG